MKKKAAFFGGTFDPIHFGHINLALELREKKKIFDEVLFCPANISPHKLKSPPIASAKDRLEMIKLAIKDIPGFSVCDLEIKRKGPSFTFDTVQKLIKEGMQLNIILTIEGLKKIHLWKNYLELIKIAPPIIGLRDFSDFNNKNLKIPTKNFIKTNIMQISSTDLRERIKKKLYCGHLVSKEVLDYIYQNDLYC